ncbi:MAG: hypothetical protein JXB32_14165 [Deltaproteobacteria bacterium]|nr:hypothetical protein [Deltaproteobacteria bacterium]
MIALTLPAAALADEPQHCLGSTHCPPPLVCSADGRCERPACVRTADCRSPSDVCLAERCFAPQEAPGVRDGLRAAREAEPNEGLAFGLTFLLPGLGQFYAGDPWGLVPLAAVVGGDALLLRGIVIGLIAAHQDNDEDLTEAKAMMISGAGLILAAFVGGAIWAYFVARNHNEGLRREVLERAGTPVWVSSRFRLSVGTTGLRLTW